MKFQQNRTINKNLTFLREGRGEGEPLQGHMKGKYEIVSYQIQS